VKPLLKSRQKRKVTMAKANYRGKYPRSKQLQPNARDLAGSLESLMFGTF